MIPRSCGVTFTTFAVNIDEKSRNMVDVFCDYNFTTWKMRMDTSICGFRFVAEIPIQSPMDALNRYSDIKNLYETLKSSYYTNMRNLFSNLLPSPNNTVDFILGNDSVNDKSKNSRKETPKSNNHNNGITSIPLNTSTSVTEPKSKGNNVISSGPAPKITSTPVIKRELLPIINVNVLVSEPIKKMFNEYTECFKNKVKEGAIVNEYECFEKLSEQGTNVTLNLYLKRQDSRFIMEDFIETAKEQKCKYCKNGWLLWIVVGNCNFDNALSNTLFPSFTPSFINNKWENNYHFLPLRFSQVYDPMKESFTPQITTSPQDFADTLMERVISIQRYIKSNEKH